MSKLNFSYDEKEDVMEIEGRMYSGNFFRNFGSDGFKSGQVFEFDKENGIFIVKKLDAKYYVDPNIKHE